MPKKVKRKVAKPSMAAVLAKVRKITKQIKVQKGRGMLGQLWGLTGL